jgi:glycosyltransferase involved in cell wall biosynthesis
MELPTVSIVIPTYNSSGTIRETSSSALKQDYPMDKMEIVVVDDGSDDDTVSVVRDTLSSTKIAWSVLEQENRGPSAARNAGWRRAHGKWIQFLDADDWIAPEKLRTQTNRLTDTPPDVAVVYSSWQACTQQNGHWVSIGAPRLPRVESDPVVELLHAENFIHLGSQLVCRNWLTCVGGFNGGYYLIEDVDLALRIAMAGAKFLIVESERPLFQYRQHEQSLSNRDKIEFVSGCVRNARMVEAHWRSQTPDLRVDQRAALIAVYGQALRFYFEHDRASFRSLLDHVRSITGRYYPAGRTLAALSRLIGYPAAEAVALGYRRAKRQVLSSTRSNR